MITDFIKSNNSRSHAAPARTDPQPDRPASDPRSPPPVPRLLTAAEFQGLADVPPEVEWFANLGNPSTRRAYENAVKDFMRFAGIVRPEEFRTVTRAHLIAWRDELVRRGLGGGTIRHRLASLASLFEYLCEKNAVTHNPVKGVERPKTESGEGKTPAIGDHQARKLLDAPQDDTIKSKRDRAILSTLLFHALRREELCKLKVKDFRHARKGVPHLKVSGKGGKTRYMPLHPGTNGLIHDYLEAAGHGGDDAGALFRPLRNNRDRPARPGDHAGRRLQAGAGLFGRARLRDRRARAARDRRHQRARSPGRHRQGAGVARPRQHRHHADLRSPPHPAGGQPDVQGHLLMAKSVPALVNPAMLLWAREGARLSIDEAAHKIGIAAEKLAACETEDAQLTFHQLMKAASVYKRPVSLFYLKKPPAGWAPIRDFRRLADAEAGFSPRLTYVIRQARERRELALELRAELNEPVQPFTLTARVGRDVEGLGEEIRAYLGVTDARTAAMEAARLRSLAHGNGSQGRAGVHGAASAARGNARNGDSRARIARDSG